MQISELNNNLLNMLTGQAGAKTENEETSRFADLLQLSKSPESGKTTMLAAKTDGKVAAFGKEISNAPVAAQDKNSTRATAPKAEKNVKANGKSDSAQPQKKNDNNVKANQTADRPASEATDATTVSQSAGTITAEKNVETETGNIMVENAVVVAPIALPLPDGLFTINTGDFVSDVVSEETAVLLQPEMDILPEISTEPVQNDIVSEENVKQQVSEPELEETVNPALIEKTVVENNVEQPELVQEQPREVVETMPEKESVVRVQEEKIAERLPDDVKVDIKVAVTEDKVTAAPIRQSIAPESFVFEDEITPVEEIQNDVEVNKQVSENTEIQQPVATIIEDGTKENSVSAFVKVASTEHEVSNVQAQVAGAVIEETTPTAVKAETAEIKTFEPKNLTREVAEQIKVNITQSAIKGVDKIEIQLKPADLGKVEIKLQIGRDGQLHAHIVASNAETLEILQKDIENLKQAFSSAGYQAEDGSFSFSHSQEQSNEREKMREFIGEVITRDVEEELAANDYISADGVNIRV